ncbi:uncharacterized protein LOC112604090 [Melanaphis sacchari]|uniref:uncharacterized protein LOC112604090 n=1 Tax=Melanaphis sacchari TaxID=742174 RepID=UPI000DC144AB|nr:uncharacterized protein LOC112604090 [Melanaphis sacchari]
MNNEEIKIVSQLARKIKFLVTSLNTMRTIAAESSPDVINRNQVHSRIEELDVMGQSIEEMQDKLELLEEKPDEERILEQLNFQSKIIDVKASLRSLLDNNSLHSSSSCAASVGREGRNRTLRLPYIEIPSFDGNIQNWSSFIDSFNAAFHNIPELKSVQKFFFLKSNLAGTASDVVKNIPLTNDNYHQAYAKLTERYENSGLIIQFHIRALFNTPKVQFASES